MLVLSRKVGEVIRISDDIIITVVDIDRGKVRLGFDAPQKTPIYREEIWDEMRKTKIEPNELPPNTVQL